MAFPSRLPLRDMPFRYLLNFFSAIQSLAIILDNSESVAREVLRELGYGENQINYMYDKYKRPIFEALISHRDWKGTVQDLYRVLSSTNQTEALQTLFTFLRENLNDRRHVPDEATKANWAILLDSTQYRISPDISWPRVFMKTYIFPIYSRVQKIVYMMFPFSTAYASDMYRSISNLMNNVIIVVWFLTVAQNAMTIYQEGRLQYSVTIFISLSLWIKLYLMNAPFNQLRGLLPLENDEQNLRRADFLYKEIRIALLFVFFFKLALAMFGCALFYAFPDFLLEDLQSKMTQFALFLFVFELAHNAFYLNAFYWDPNIFRIINDLFPM
ncbi:uncharacterized protein LOC115918693 [Strongylocentrotus purpuratus]|uniref:Uncharacterized protein n=1 Tax=Strongylocentrotus purpuratus TaxID=7668 RepID=A0A7M7NYR6_STRPU|nr:uncharacterized protein LOC100889740 [Strongylocentrotus purpuratus]XP_030842970.1 uncharacterized protein LOC115918693 [Strongylocentrotus purpuratus]|eukprot:XP_003726243.2 PREDICTED: uncharacterized protein LOC100889740 [Strongylocentrotus purpuratus]